MSGFELETLFEGYLVLAEKKKLYLMSCLICVRVCAFFLEGGGYSEYKMLVRFFMNQNNNTYYPIVLLCKKNRLRFNKNCM